GPSPAPTPSPSPSPSPSSSPARASAASLLPVARVRGARGRQRQRRPAAVLRRRDGRQARLPQPLALLPDPLGGGDRRRAQRAGVGRGRVDARLVEAAE